MGEERSNLLQWQWELYGAAHRERKNLLVHALTVPIFMGGTALLLLPPLFSFWLAPGGLAAMVFAAALQGRTHRLEAVRPMPFQGPWDVFARLMLEQWITFPRFVWTGGFGRAWRRT
jgi:hypothetical protein